MVTVFIVSKYTDSEGRHEAPYCVCSDILLAEGVVKEVLHGLGRVSSEVMFGTTINEIKQAQDYVDREKAYHKLTARERQLLDIK